MWTKLQKEVDLEDPTSLMDQVYLEMHAKGRQRLITRQFSLKPSGSKSSRRQGSLTKKIPDERDGVRIDGRRECGMVFEFEADGSP